MSNPQISLTEKEKQMNDLIRASWKSAVEASMIAREIESTAYTDMMVAIVGLSQVLVKVENIKEIPTHI